MQGILLKSLPTLISSFGERLKTSSLLEVLSCIPSLNLADVTMQQREQVSQLLHIAAPVFVQRAQMTCQDLQRQLVQDPDHQKEGPSGSKDIEDGKEETVKLDVADWKSWEAASRAFTMGEMSSEEDRVKVLGALGELRKYHMRNLSQVRDEQDAV